MSDVSKESLTGFNPAAMYSIERVTDMLAGEIEIFTPITLERTRDVGRPIRYRSSVNLMFNGRPLTVSFEIEAADLAGAIAGFADAAQGAAAKQVEAMEAARLKQSLLSAAGGMPIGRVN